MEKDIEEQSREIRKKIEELKKQKQSLVRDEKIVLLNTLIDDIQSRNFPSRSQIVWPSSSSSSPLREMMEILSIVERIESGEKMTLNEMKGMVSRSRLLNIKGFDYILDAPAEYMHSTCLGLIKRLVELTFKVGESRPRITKRKLTPASSFNKLISKVKVTKEFPRRIRQLDFAVYKALEFRNLAIFFPQL